MGNSKYAPQERYQAAHMTVIRAKINDRTDQDILDHLKNIDNIQGYIKALIRADMARASKTDKD